MVEAALQGRPILLTGATGFLGTHLARELVRQGAVVHALRRDPSRSTRLPCPGLIWHTADLLDPSSLREAIRQAQPSIVYHLAANAVAFDPKSDADTFQVNVVGAWNLWEALGDVQCRLVHAGSCGEYGQAKGQVVEDRLCEPTWFYPATKNASVVLLSTLGRCRQREVVTLRPFGPYGPADDPSRIIPSAIGTLLRGEEMRVTAGEQLRDFAHVDDHVAAFVLAGVRPLPGSGQVFNTGSGEVVSLRSAIEVVAHAVGGDALDRVRFGAIAYRPTELWEMCCDIRAAQTVLGFQPRVSFADGIARTVAWYREQTPNSLKGDRA